MRNLISLAIAILLAIGIETVLSYLTVRIIGHTPIVLFVIYLLVGIVTGLVVAVHIQDGGN